VYLEIVLEFTDADALSVFGSNRVPFSQTSSVSGFYFSGCFFFFVILQKGPHEL